MRREAGPGQIMALIELIKRGKIASFNAYRALKSGGDDRIRTGE
jgi:hypothetical protein